VSLVESDPDTSKAGWAFRPRKPVRLLFTCALDYIAVARYPCKSTQPRAIGTGPLIACYVFLIEYDAGTCPWDLALSEHMNVYIDAQC
jgi:hypothetical protein